MGENFGRFFKRGSESAGLEALGADMAPSPDALAERSALSTEAAGKTKNGESGGPFSTVISAPMRDFTG